MFTAEALRGWVNDVRTNTAAMTAPAATAALAARARSERDRVIARERGRAGIAPLYRQVVDGVEDAELDGVRPDGVVVFAWSYLPEIVRDTYESLVMRSPRASGRYVEGLEVWVDGRRADYTAITIATRKVQIIASVPYARKLEVGPRVDHRRLSKAKQKTAKDALTNHWLVRPHIVQETAEVAKRLYGDLAEIYFNYFDLSDAYALKRISSFRRRRGLLETDLRYPGIEIEPRLA